MHTFLIEKIAIALGNSGPLRQPALAEAHLVIGDHRHRVFLFPDGQVHIPDAVPGATLRQAIATELRKHLLAHLTQVFVASDVVRADR